MQVMKQILLISTFFLLYSVVVMRHALNSAENETYNENIQSTITSSPETPQKETIENHIVRIILIIVAIVIIFNLIALICAYIVYWFRNDINNNQKSRITPPPIHLNNEGEIYEMVQLRPNRENDYAEIQETNN